MRLYRKTFDPITGRNHDPIEEQPGRWVPWCVEHEASTSPRWKPGEGFCAGGAVLRWVGAPVKPCRWHPQGAFIPEDEGGTT